MGQAESTRSGFVDRFVPGRRTRAQTMTRLARIEHDLHKLQQTIDVKTTLMPIDDRRFHQLSKEIRGHRRTMLPHDRLWTLWQAVENTSALEGAVAEVGTYRGGSAYFLAAAFKALGGKEATIEVIDTFEGHPPDRLSDHDSDVHKQQGQFADTNFDEVVDYLSPFELLTVHRGEFSSVTPRLPERSYRLAHVDVDLYEPALDCLRYFTPRLIESGVIILDDYGSMTCPGIARAAEEHLAAEPEFQAWRPRTKQLILVKRKAAGERADE